MLRLLGRSRLGGGEREEQLFQPVCLGRTQLGEQHLVVAGDARHHLGRDPTTGDVHGEHIIRPGDVVDPRSWSAAASAAGSGLRTRIVELASRSSSRPAATTAPLEMTTRMIGGGLHLVEQVTRQQHRAAMVGEVAQERSHPGDALGIEPVRRFVEDQRPRFTDEGLGDARRWRMPSE